MAKNLTKAQERYLENQKKIQDENDKLISDAEELVDLGGDLTDIQQEHIKNLKVDKILRTEVVSLEKKLEKLSLKTNKHKKFHGKLGLAQIQNLKAQRKSGTLTEASLKSQTSLIEEIASGRLTSKEIQDATNDLGDEASKGMKEYLATSKRHVKIQELQKDAVSELDNIMGGMGSTIKNFVTNPLAIATALLLTFNAQQEAIAKQFGTIGVTRFRDDLVSAGQEFTKLGLESSEALSTVSDLANSFGIGFQQARGMADEVADLSVSMGLSVEDSSKLVGLFVKTQGLSAQQAVNLTKSTVELANANDVAPDQVLADVANNAEAFANFATDGGANILRAAVQARKLGIELSSVAGAAESLIDFQSSISAEMEASILIGRQINLQKARELALTGQLEELQIEILSVVGSEAEFNAMMLPQRQALAKAIGMSVTDLQKLVSSEKEMVTLQGELSKHNLSDLIPEDAITNTAKILNDFKALGIQLAEQIGPSLNAFLGIVVGILDVTNTMIGLGPALIGIYSAIKIHAALAARHAAAEAAAKTMGAFVANPLAGAIGIGLGVAAVAAMMSSMNNAKTTAASAQEGGITTEEGLVNVHPQEAIIPLDQFRGLAPTGNNISAENIGDIMAATSRELGISAEQVSSMIFDAISPVTTAIDTFNDNFDKKYIPKLTQSNVDGAKKSSREVARQFQMNAGG